MGDEGSTTPEWEELTMSMGASFLDHSKDEASKYSFQYPILEAGGEYSHTDTAQSTNPLHGTSSGHVSEIEPYFESPYSTITANLQAPDHGNCAVAIKDAQLASSHPEMVTSEEEVRTLAPVFVENPGTNRIIKPKNLRSKGSKIVWTISIAATVMGISMLVHRLQAEVHLSHQLQTELSLKDAKLDELRHQVDRLREVITKQYTRRSSGL